jgi:hypothetical protein
MQNAIVPFWRDLGATGVEHRSYLWVLRYGRRGEHLKLRIHSPESCRCHHLQDLLARSIHGYFSTIKESLARPSLREKGEAPPIDLEDEDPARADDCTLLWTTYRRSPISLGSRAMLADDQYVGCLTRALACGLESAIEIFNSAASPQSLRRNTLLKMLISALAVSEFQASQRLNYLVYHRDWLLRVAIVTSGLDFADSGKLLEDLDRQVEKVGPGIEILKQAVDREWSNAGESGTSYLSWRHAIEELCLCLGLYRENPDLDPDPFAEDLVFLPFFKVIHGLSNQLGLRRLEEAFSIHLLLRAAGGDSPERGIRFIPA